MKSLGTLIPLFLFLFLSSVLATPPHLSNSKRFHKALRSTLSDSGRAAQSERRSSPLQNSTVESQLEKRDSFSGRATYFAVGQGACGGWNKDSDFIVAMNSAQYGSGGFCYQTITISYGGKQTQATVADECPGCPWGGLDMSPSLFQFFASESTGVIQVNWWTGGGSPAPSSSSSEWVAPTTSSSQWVAPTSTWSSSSAWVAPTTSSTPAPSSTLTTSTTVAAPTSSTASTLNTTSSLNSTLPLTNGTSTTPNPLPSSVTDSSTNKTLSDSTGGNLDVLSQLVLSLGGIVVAAANNQQHALSANA